MSHHAVVGTQWGDEGKGKIVDALAAQHDIVVRFQGGTNAGHTVVVGKEKFPLHLIPSGILHESKVCVIADGPIINPITLVEELEKLQKRVKSRAKLYISSKAQLIMPWHEVRDGLNGGKVGTTKKGIGPTYSDATSRVGLRINDLIDANSFSEKVRNAVEWNSILIASICEYHQLDKASVKELQLKKILDPEKISTKYLKAYDKLVELDIEVIDTSAYLYQEMHKGKEILFEGAQATLLDITHGDYPFVTSSHPTFGGISIGTGVRPRDLHVVGVLKAYSTRVGNGPFATELDNAIGKDLRERGHEFGTTTGRPRRCGWLDLVIAKYAVRINGLDSLAVTKLDILSGIETIKVAVAYQSGIEIFQDYPTDLEAKSKAIPLYREFPGWNEDISGVREFKKLPNNARAYIEFIEEQTGVPVRFIGVGPERDELIIK